MSRGWRKTGGIRGGKYIGEGFVRVECLVESLEVEEIAPIPNVPQPAVRPRRNRYELCLIILLPNPPLDKGTHYTLNLIIKHPKNSLKMSSDTSNFVCTSCFLNLPSSSFVRGRKTNTFFKNCITCRTRKNARRQNLRRQRYAVPPALAEETVEPINVSGSHGNDDIANNVDPQIIDLDMETNTDLTFCNVCKQNRATSLFNGPIHGKIYQSCSICRLQVHNRQHPLNIQAPITLEPNIDINRSMMYCSMCKKNCPSDLFINDTPNSPFSTCSNCRSLQHSRRFPSIFSTRPLKLNTMFPLSQEQDIYDASDDENNDLDAQVMSPDNQEVVGDEALANDEPVIILSHTDSREYAAHMRVREALPDNHDDIFNNLPDNNLEQDSIDPFETDYTNLNNQINMTTINNEPERIEPEVETTTAPLRLPQWLAPLPTHRTVPAAYISRYTRNLPTHNLGRCTSVCPSCHALHWPQERVHSSSVARPQFQICCKDGQVVLNEMPEPPAYLRWLWTSEDRDAKEFRKNSRQYNRAFAFTSFKYTADRRLADRGIHGGLRSFSIHGQIYHQTGAAMREGAVPRYAQLYFVGSERAVEARTEGNNLNPDIVRSLTELIEQNNPFIEYYHTALRSLQESEQQGSLRVVLNPEFRLIIKEHTDRRRYNLPTTNEVAVAIPDGLIGTQETSSYLRGTVMVPYHRGLSTFHVIILPTYRCTTSSSILLAIQDFTGQFQSKIRECEKLFQQICCDMYACVDDNILNWHRINQSTVRSDLYSGVMDALQSDRADQIGDPVILALKIVGVDLTTPVFAHGQ
ncbi:hypothetical protein EPUL_004006, partial [Erysiphe pulchra]